MTSCENDTPLRVPEGMVVESHVIAADKRVLSLRRLRHSLVRLLLHLGKNKMGL